MTMAATTSIRSRSYKASKTNSSRSNFTTARSLPPKGGSPQAVITQSCLLAKEKEDDIRYGHQIDSTLFSLPSEEQGLGQGIEEKEEKKLHITNQQKNAMHANANEWRHNRIRYTNPIYG